MLRVSIPRTVTKQQRFVRGKEDGLLHNLSLWRNADLRKNDGDYAWTMASAALVFMMIPGIAWFYAGLRSQQTALSIVWVTMMSVSIVFIQWYLFGFSLAFSPFSKSNFIGDLSFAHFKDTTGPGVFAGNSTRGTPALVYGVFQGMFAAFTIALVAGVVAERGRLIPFLIFTILWSTFVYDPIAYWIWNENGWSNKQGGLDWAGGTPVHICSGGTALAYTLMLKYNRMLVEDREMFNEGRVTWKTHLFLSKAYRNAIGKPDGPRFAPTKETGNEPHNMMFTLLGTMLVWFGWFGFNAGSELEANSRAASTFMASNLAACSGGITFCLLEMIKRGSRWSGFGFCTGAFVGLVAITPGAGWVPPWAGLVFGPLASLGCYLSMLPADLEDKIEEPFIIPVVHGLGGLIGMFCTGFFADSATAGLDGTQIEGGWLNQNWKQMGWQMCGGFAGLGWSFGISSLILIVLQLFSVKIKWLRLRADEMEGRFHEINLDDAELGGDKAAYQISCINHASASSRPHTPPTSRDQPIASLPRRPLTGAPSEAHPNNALVPALSSLQNGGGSLANGHHSHIHPHARTHSQSRGASNVRGNTSLRGNLSMRGNLNSHRHRQDYTMDVPMDEFHDFDGGPATDIAESSNRDREWERRFGAD